MTPEQQRIAIAEACGFKITRIDQDEDGTIRFIWGETPESWNGPDARPWLPDFCNDLNAMHAAWCSLDPQQHIVFRNELRSIVNRDGFVVGPCQSLCNATAAQRAEAFVRVFDWKEAA